MSIYIYIYRERDIHIICIHTHTCSRQVWTVFDELEDAWGPSSPNSKAPQIVVLYIVCCSIS